MKAINEAANGHANETTYPKSTIHSFRWLDFQPQSGYKALSIHSFMPIQVMGLLCMLFSIHFITQISNFYPFKLVGRSCQVKCKYIAPSLISWLQPYPPSDGVLEWRTIWTSFSTCFILVYMLIWTDWQLYFWCHIFVKRL